MNFAQLVDAVPVVQTTAERATRFPSPLADQRVYNKETFATERFDKTSGTWVSELGLSTVVATGSTTPRSLQDRFGNAGLKDIRDYGGAATASAAANAAALLAAHNAAAPVFGTVYIPAGNWDLAAFPSPWSQLVGLRGDGLDATVLFFTPTSGDALTVSGATNGIKHRFRGFTLAPKTTCSGNGMVLAQFKFSIMDHVRIRNFGGSGLTLADSYFSSFRNCVFDGNGVDGVTLDLDANVLTFTTCDFDSNLRAGAFLRGARAASFKGCAFEVNAVGLYITADTARNTAAASVGGSYFEGNTANDILVKSLNAGATKPKGVTIRDNYFQPLTVNTMDAIEVDHADSVTIDANVFDNLAGWSYSHSLLLGVGGASRNVVFTDRNLDASTNKVFAGHGLAQLGHREVVGPFTATDAAANQTNLSLAGTRWVAHRPGSVTGVVVKTNEARTAGTCTISVYKNTGLAGAAGAAIGLTAALNAATPGANVTYAPTDLLTFAVGDELYLVLTTDAGWLPITADLVGNIEVAF